MYIGTRLKRLRLEHLVSQTEFASRTQLHRVTINRPERNLRPADYETIRKLARWFGVEPGLLVDEHQPERGTKEAVR